MIIRAQRRETFTVVNNTAINDNRLSFRAKGVLVYILSKPDNWRVSESGHHPNGSALPVLVAFFRNQYQWRDISGERP